MCNYMVPLHFTNTKNSLNKSFTHQSVNIHTIVIVLFKKIKYYLIIYQTKNMGNVYSYYMGDTPDTSHLQPNVNEMLTNQEEKPLIVDETGEVIDNLTEDGVLVGSSDELINCEKLSSSVELKVINLTSSSSEDLNNSVVLPSGEDLNNSVVLPSGEDLNNRVVLPSSEDLNNRVVLPSDEDLNNSVVIPSDEDLNNSILNSFSPFNVVPVTTQTHGDDFEKIYKSYIQDIQNSYREKNDLNTSYSNMLNTVNLSINIPNIPKKRKRKRRNAAIKITPSPTSDALSLCDIPINQAPVLNEYQLPEWAVEEYLQEKIINKCSNFH